MTAQTQQNDPTLPLPPPGPEAYPPKMPDEAAFYLPKVTELRNKMLGNVDAIVGKTVEYVRHFSDRDTYLTGIFFTDGHFIMLTGHIDDTDGAVSAHVYTDFDMYIASQLDIVTTDEVKTFADQYEAARKAWQREREIFDLKVLRAKYPDA